MDKKALRDVSYGMYIVGTKDGSRLTGCTVNTVIQVSSEPAVVAVCVNHSNFTNLCIKASGGFAVSILSEATAGEVIATFGFRSGKEVSKFDNLPHQSTPGGYPVLTSGVCGWLECKLINTVELESHTLFFGALTEAQQLGGNPMTYDYYHKVIKGKAPAAAPTYEAEQPAASGSATWVCDVCGHVYDGAEGPFEDLPPTWTCPICGVGKERFSKK